MAGTPDKSKKKVAASAARAGATVKRVTKKRAAAATVASATYEDIARRAYELFESGAGGDAVEHWLQAERELIAA
jgi:hypothetical protein